MNYKATAVDQRTELLSDGFEITTPDIRHFLEEAQEFTVSQGYGGANIATVSGRSDDCQINISPRSFEMSIRCRDNLALALDTPFRKSYFLYPPPITPQDRFGNAIAYSHGQIMASQVASDACSAAGLSVAWDCPDYPIVNSIVTHEGFDGSAADCLKKLVEPFNRFEMYAVDIYAEGTVVYIKKRRFPYVADSDNVIDLGDLRIKGFRLSREKAHDRQIRDIYVIREERLPTTEILQRTESEVVESKDNGGNVLTRSITTKYYRLAVCYRKVLNFYQLLNPRFAGTGGSTLQSSSLVLTLRAVVDYDYGPVIQSNYNKLNSSAEKITEYTIKDKLYTYLSKKTTVMNRYAYNGNDELVMEDSLKESQKYDEAGALSGDPEYEQETITHEQTTKDLVESTIVTVKNGEFVGRTVQTTSGQLPGPKMVGMNKNASANNRETETWWQRVPVNATGEDVEIEDNRLTREQLLMLADEGKTEQGKNKYLLDLTVLPMPWLRKGMIFRINGVISDGLGNSFDLNQLNLLITGLRYEMTNKQFLGTVRAIAWA